MKTPRKNMAAIFVLLACLTSSPGAGAVDTSACRRLSVEAYRDKMAAGWIGQMAGVGWGAPTEFRYRGVIIPENEVPKWTPRTINQFQQDDLYVEMTFLRSLAIHGFDLSIRQAGIDFANSGYQLWHANRAGRENLRKGIAPPDSGHPRFSRHSDDIDYQIEADYAGLIAPGMPNVAIALGEKFGRIMNYGDGLYGGQFVAGMYAAAFFERNPRKIVEAGLACIPAESQYAGMVRDVLRWYDEAPENWQSTWRHIDETYHRSMDHRRYACGSDHDFNIDAKYNGACIITGLLYGAGNPDDTMVIAMRCGQDSDCNPSNAGGILFTALGLKQLPARFTSALDRSATFSHTLYNFDTLLKTCEKLARQAVVRSGGRIEMDGTGRETFVIPVTTPKPSALEKSWAPGPIAHSRFTRVERKRINPPGWSAPRTDLSEAVSAFAPGWRVRDCGDAMEPGLRAKWGGRENVLLTHPLSSGIPCVLYRDLTIPAGKKTMLHLAVGHDERGNWDLAVRVGARELFRTSVGKETARNGWLDADIDLTEYAGQPIQLELCNEATGWHYEGAYWAGITIESR